MYYNDDQDHNLFAFLKFQMEHIKIVLVFQNCIAIHESNGLDIITALILNDINPLGKTRMDLVLELKNNASKLLLAIMESRGDSENAERILYNMNPKQLVSASTLCSVGLTSKVSLLNLKYSHKDLTSSNKN